MSNQPVIIIGTGLAGYSTAKEFRKHDKETPLVIVSSDDGYSYSKPMLSNAIGRGQEAYDLPNGDIAKMAETLNADVRANCSVSALSPESRTIQCDGQTLEYQKLVLALGAEQRQVPFSGDAADSVISVNNLEQYAAFRDAIKSAKNVACVGAGLIGSEFANDLALGGFSVDVVEPFPYPLGRLVPAEVGEAVRKALDAMGVKFHLGETCDDVSRDGGGYRLTLSNGESISSDVVLTAVGLVPRTELARAAGLDVNEAIVVNRELQTSAADVYALGDCMEVEGLMLPYIMPIMHAARALGKTLAGESTRLSYPVMPVVVKTPAHPVVVSSPPKGAAGEWQVDANDDGVRAVFVSTDGEPVGFVVSGSRMPEKNALAKEVPPVMA
jgi:rubredoxin-NAD+ reductase